MSPEQKAKALAAFAAFLDALDVEAAPAKPVDVEPLVSIAKVAETLGCSAPTAKATIARLNVPHYMAGDCQRYRLSEVLEATKNAPAPVRVPNGVVKLSKTG